MSTEELFEILFGDQPEPEERARILAAIWEWVKERNPDDDPSEER